MRNQDVANGREVSLDVWSVASLCNLPSEVCLFGIFCGELAGGE